MKKIITAIAFIALSTVSAKAISLPNISMPDKLSITAGFASNQSVWGASGKQKSFSESGGTANNNDSTHGVFQESYSSQFLELGLGKYISVGYELVPDSISTPENVEEKHEQTSTKVSVDFNDFETTYLKLNLPGGVYVKSGIVKTDLDIKETIASGNTYKNVSTEGTSIGFGYQRFLGDTPLGIRFETNYVELDSVKTDNGVSLTGGTSANGGRNEITASNLEGVTAKVAITLTLGRNN